MGRRGPVLAALFATTTLLATTAGPALAEPPYSSWDYAALGDSYSSGVGAPGQTGTCSRSPNAYAPLWADEHDPASFTFVACAGATTADLREDQLSALGTGTDLVSLTIGGNDIGFADVIVTCKFGTDAACITAVDEALVTLEEVTADDLAETFAEVTDAAPNAEVVVLGYPLLFDTSSSSCGIGGISLTKRKKLNEGATELNAVIRAEAQAAGVTWSDVTDEFAGHGICGASPWLNGLTVIPVTDSYHPNAAGYASGYLPGLESAV